MFDQLYHMIKKQLSSNLLAEKILIAIVLITTLPVLLVIYDYPAIGIFIAIIYVFCWFSLHTIYSVVSDVSYDESQLYIKHKKREKSIELRNIDQIKLTARWGSWRSQWRITYIENKEEKKVYFYLKYGLVSLMPFVKAVKRQNPKVDYVYIALDIDID